MSEGNGCIHRGDGRVVMPSDSRIGDLDEVKKFISEYDLRAVRWSLTENPMPWDYRWSQDHAQFAEQMYRRWIFLARSYETERISPTYDIDGFWHAHILDTDDYACFCDHVFGYLLPHHGGFGSKDAAEAARLEESFRCTREYYEREFGEPLYEQDVT